MLKGHRNAASRREIGSIWMNNNTAKHNFTCGPFQANGHFQNEWILLPLKWISIECQIDVRRCVTERCSFWEML